MAEGLFIHLVESEGIADKFEIDSAGTSAYHAGEWADRRMRATAASHGIALTTKSRQFRKQDLSDFDHILAMDRSNLSNIKSMQSEGASYRGSVELMRAYDERVYARQSESLDVPDPYYGGEDGFEEVYDILWRSNLKLLEVLRNKHGI